MLRWIKRYKWWLIIGGIILLIIGLIVGGIHLEEQQQAEFKQEMNQELKEHKGLIISSIKDSGTNKSFLKDITIYYDKTEHNPMGGIEFYGYVNNDPKLEFGGNLNKTENDHYEIANHDVNSKLFDLLNNK
ncbi:DUF1310 family protein [Bombilactobacillus thymidiniphilus]|uniref:DUF1310 domain-containing protein n=1 Tax=Bombilactobacillus thymidiniphilus TaxID=2923363 RepID=A0ABY4PF47_9LACO|nr:DUF1310 family protein [Bombilactobacillus thymidiniphilus]UQS84265.1 DUF1310 domain-containing protein [Bombilactobacillus thymidiniphilus]